MTRKKDQQQTPPPASARDAEQEVLRKRAESLALEQVDQAEEERVGVLLFSLGDEWYGVRIAEVRELCNEYTITPIPCVPDYISGVINIRGEIVSVVDLRTMMGARVGQAQPAGQATPVIVVSDATVCTALMVDAIGDIIDVSADLIDPPIAVSDRTGADYVGGMVYSGGKLVALVNVSRVLAPVVSG